LLNFLQLSIVIKLRFYQYLGMFQSPKCRFQDYSVLLERARTKETIPGGLTLGKLQDIEAELEDFAAKLDKVTNLPYEPLIDDGVRVNIAPLQKVGVLKHSVLAGKDVDRAIADRNRWREDDKEQDTVWRI